MKYRDLVLEHLSAYKVDALGIEEDGIFNYRGNEIPKSHILPLADKDRNIIEKFREKYFSSQYSNIKLHRFFHHLNSSQALCINLFFPLIALNRLHLFWSFLGLDGAADLFPLFEKESDIEKTARKTSFDFFVSGGDSKVFVEVKYTENGFGKAKNDEEHRRKFENTYLPILKQKSSFLMPQCSQSDFFFSHYQLLRNLVHVSETDYVVLLFPSANTEADREAYFAYTDLLTDAGRDRLKIVYLEEFVPFLEKQTAGTGLEGYFKIFQEKYLPDTSYIPIA